MIFNTLKFIYNHPLNRGRKFKSIFIYFKWQLFSRILSFPIIYQFTENSRLIMWNGLTGATGNLYCGLMDFNDMAFMLHFLRPNDLFVDIGANVGAYTVLASAEIKATTIAIEPIPATFKSLSDNININNCQYKVTALNIGLGSEISILNFTSTLDTVNHVAQSSDQNTIQIPVKTLDDILDRLIPVLIKIDVEGFETEVLKGASSTLANNELKAIIIELNGSGTRYGFNDELIHDKLLQNGFEPFEYEPFNKRLIKLSTFGKNNTIYLRDLSFIVNRVDNSRKVFIGKDKIKL